jgi:hypothetical protein
MEKLHLLPGNTYKIYLTSEGSTYVYCLLCNYTGAEIEMHATNQPIVTFLFIAAKGNSYYAEGEPIYIPLNHLGTFVKQIIPHEGAVTPA